MTPGENIARLRAAKNRSQGELADALDVPRQSASKWEADAPVPELDRPVQLSERFNVSPDELVKGEAAKADEPAPPPVRTAIVERPARNASQAAKRGG